MASHIICHRLSRKATTFWARATERGLPSTRTGHGTALNSLREKPYLTFQSYCVTIPSLYAWERFAWIPKLMGEKISLEFFLFRSILFLRVLVWDALRSCIHVHMQTFTIHRSSTENVRQRNVHACTYARSWHTWVCARAHARTPAHMDACNNLFVASKRFRIHRHAYECKLCVCTDLWKRTCACMYTQTHTWVHAQISVCKHTLQIHLQNAHVCMKHACIIESCLSCSRIYLLYTRFQHTQHTCFFVLYTPFLTRNSVVWTSRTKSCMYVCIHIHICMYVYIITHICVYIHTYVYVYVCVCVCTCVCIRTCTLLLFVYVFKRKFLHQDIRGTYIHTHTHTHMSCLQVYSDVHTFTYMYV